jgi:hypothetical protein
MKKQRKGDIEPLWLDPKNLNSIVQTKDSSKVEQKMQTRGYHTSAN